MVGALFDTNILIDYLRGDRRAEHELALYDDQAISVVSWIEVMVGAEAAVAGATEAFLSGFAQVGLDETVARETVALRRERRLRLPDALIWASARASGRLLVTRDAKAFPAEDPGIRHPYAPML